MMGGMDKATAVKDPGLYDETMLSESPRHSVPHKPDILVGPKQLRTEAGMEKGLQTNHGLGM